MTQAFSSANLNHSRLVRFLTELGPTHNVPVPQQFAERLGRFLDFSDAITLSAVLDDAARQPFCPHPASYDAIEAEFLAVRSSLISGIVKSCTPGNEQARVRLPGVPLHGPFDPAALFDRYHRFYATHQQHSDDQIRILRNHIRNAIAGVSPALKQLAALDITFEDILADHARKLLATIPRILEMRFNQLFQQHQALHEHQEPSAQSLQDNRATRTQPNSWIAQFNRDIQGLLLAELDLRLQPVLGLVEAFSNEVQKRS